MPIQITQSFLYELIFKTILQVPQCGPGGGWGCLTGNFSHDFIYALLLPHIVLLVFLYIVSRTELIFQKHTGLGTLFGLGVYIFIVYSGWYAFLASWLVIWLALTIVLAFGYFFLGKIISPSLTKGRFEIGKKVGGYLSKPWDKQRKLNKINEDIAIVNRELDKHKDNEKLAQKLAELKLEKRQIERE